ncbi:hypothetical protein MCAG_00835 [Micromonospora sp. ATCC 39149]|nr:hypothetical protein MCAG_00835 [Micromonospora sp. ATCC 39149]
MEYLICRSIAKLYLACEQVGKPLSTVLGGLLGLAQAGPARDRTGSWPTRHTVPAPTDSTSPREGPIGEAVHGRKLRF